MDERLVHGQVAFAWTNSLGADCILVVNDEAAADKIRATTLKPVSYTHLDVYKRQVEGMVSHIVALGNHSLYQVRTCLLYTSQDGFSDGFAP